jgi:hypothetical protein
MQIEKHTVVDERTVTKNGIILIRFRKEIVEDGVVLARTYHRTSLEPGQSLDKQMAAVNDHLVSMGHAAVSVDGIASIQRTVDTEHTPEKIAAFQDVRAAKMLGGGGACRTQTCRRRWRRNENPGW